MKLLFFSLIFLSSCQSLDQIVNVAQNYLTPSQGEIGLGLQEALSKGINIGAERVSKTDGFFKNELIKILIPKEAQVVTNTLSQIGMKPLVDKAILSMNRAAEDAAKKSIPIFASAITSLTFSDALSILKSGNPAAATDYLKSKTASALIASFKPSIASSLEKVNATKYWADVMNTYNQIPLVKKVNPDLTDHVTSSAISGLFSQIAKEEENIRKNPLARTTELLKRVFNQQ